MPAQWLIEGEVTRLKEVFKQEIETGVINERESLESMQDFQEAHSLKSVTLKLRRMRSEYNENAFLSVEQETGSEKVLRFLSSATCQSDISGASQYPRLNN